MTAITTALHPLPVMSPHPTAAAQPLSATQPTAVEDPPVTPPLPNFTGALAWPIPLAEQHRETIIALLKSHPGTLSDLLSGSSVSATDLKNPHRALEKLLDSPKAKALGEAIQTKLGGIATAASRSDYALAALQLGFDPAPRRDSVAGFDLTRTEHWGQPATVVIDALAKHLIEQGTATESSAALAARLLLARTAPEYLVQNIPASVTYGSVTWVQLALAVARLEADSPGRVLTMGYAEVLAAGADPRLTQLSPHEALQEWAVVKGVLKRAEAPTDARRKQLRSTFNQQLTELKATSMALATPVPSRETLALEALRDAFPDVDESVFRARSLQKTWLNAGRNGSFPGTRSMLDVVMEGDTVNAANGEHWTTQDSRIPIEAFCQLSAAGKMSIAQPFKDGYDLAINTLESGHRGLVKYLISSLPPQERKDFELGKLEFFHTCRYKIADDFHTPPTLVQRGHTLDVKTTREGQVNVYEIDTRNGSIKKKNYRIKNYQPPYTAHQLESREGNTLSKTVVLKPSDANTANRSEFIAKVFVDALNLRHDDMLQHARGMTSYDKTRASNEAIKDLFLNLVPLRSAIVNFNQGNVGEGLQDLGWDVIGLVSSGVGKAAQAGKVVGKGLATVNGLAKAARFIGAAAIDAFNPLGGLGDLAKGGAHLLNAGLAKGRQAVNALRGASGSYDLLKAASARHGLAATGSYTLAQQTLESGAIFRDGNWYAYDVARQQPYGPALAAFHPDVTAAGGEVRAVAAPDLTAYAVADIAPQQLAVKGLQANVFVGPNHTEYVKIDGRLYASRLKDGQRLVTPPSGAGAEFPVRDLGVAGWAPTSSTHRLLGGGPDAAPTWQVKATTYVVPIDDIKIHDNPLLPYSITCKGVQRSVTFDCQVGAWRTAGPLTGIDPGNHSYCWRTRKGQWEMGPLDAFKKAKKIEPHQFRFVDISPPVILDAPKDVKPIPKDIHYFWAGGEIPPALIKNMVANAENSPGYRSIIHIDADDPQTVQRLKIKLEIDAPGFRVMDLNQEEFFKTLKQSEIYSYFRQGQGKNLAATSDVARYPLMEKYGGIYLDTDDVIKQNVGDVELSAGSSDILLSKPVAHKITRFQPFYNTSNFATQPDNPVLKHMTQEMNRRFALNKSYFTQHRPTATRDAKGGVNYTPEFLEYERKIFDTVGPSTFDRVLKAHRPDMYDIGFDGGSKELTVSGPFLRPGPIVNLENEVRAHYASKGIKAPEQLGQRLKDMKDHYLSLHQKFPIKIGAEHSWIDS